VLVVNADQLHRFAADAGNRLPAGGRRAGLWSWELPDLPPWLDRAFDLLDEVWASSQFTADAIAARAPVPVHLFPQPVVADPPTTLTRADLGLPAGPFAFGFACDARSVLRRKNPVGLLRAYRDAFPDDGRHHLLVKVVHGGADPVGMEELRWAARGRSDVTVVDETWTPARAEALLQLVDCYASLHRSEGYGLGLAQAMAQGTPVVATGWSGNLSFMDDTDAHLVPSRLVPVGHAPPYPADGAWAEPDHDAAVAVLRAVAADPDAARARAAAAADRIRERFSVERAASWLLDRAADASYDVARRAAEGAA
jgi:glycosyltransferase involved in cell wall biosynthesis